MYEPAGIILADGNLRSGRVGIGSRCAGVVRRKPGPPTARRESLSWRIFPVTVKRIARTAVVR